MTLDAIFELRSGTIQNGKFEFVCGRCEEAMNNLLADDGDLISITVLHPTLKGVFIKKSKSYEKR